MSKLRILFMGTPDFAVAACRAVCEQYQLVGVVTQPDRPKGRGGKLAAPPVKMFAESVGVPVFQPQVLKDGALLPVLEQTDPELIVVAAYGRILPKYVLQYPRLGCINIHGSLLPKYRGAAPIQRAIIEGEKETGVTIMKMAEGLDTGDMILQEKLPILPTDTAGTLFDRMAALGASALLKAIPEIENGTAVYTSQDDALATYAPMIDKAEGEINFKEPATKLKALIMGLSPAPGAFIANNEGRIKIYEAAVGDKADAPAGTVTHISKAGIGIACGDGCSLILKTMQKPGKNKTDAYSYACGAKLAVGEPIK